MELIRHVYLMFLIASFFSMSITVIALVNAKVQDDD